MDKRTEDVFISFRDKDWFRYPPDFAHALYRKWRNFQYDYKATISSEPSPEFPSLNLLRPLVDILYHLSFQKEEARNLSIRIAYVSHRKLSQYSENGIITSYSSFYKLKQAQPLTLISLVKLAPALDYKTSILLVTGKPCDQLGLEYLHSKELVIWGIVHQGFEWWKFVSNQDITACSPPNVLTISVSNPGNLIASTTGRFLIGLRNGSIITDINSGFESDPLKNLKKTADELLDELQREKNISEIVRHAEDFFHPIIFLRNTIGRIVNCAAEMNHGATFIFFDNEIDLEDSCLNKLIDIKYHIENLSGWDLIKDVAMEIIASTSKSYHNENEDYDFLDSVISNEQYREASQKLNEFQSFVATLSGVDGVVVLTNRLKVIGFGGEIKTGSKNFSEVWVKDKPSDSDNEMKSSNINKYGTRHRSVFRLCSNCMKCWAIVISQDGGIKVVKRIGSEVVVWTDLQFFSSAL